MLDAMEEDGTALTDRQDTTWGSLKAQRVVIGTELDDGEPLTQIWLVGANGRQVFAMLASSDDASLEDCRGGFDELIRNTKLAPE